MGLLEGDPAVSEECIICTGIIVGPFEGDPAVSEIMHYMY